MDPLEKARSLLKLRPDVIATSGTVVELSREEIHTSMKAQVLMAWYEEMMRLNFKITRIKRKGKSKIKRVVNMRNHKIIRLYMQIAAISAEIQMIEAQPFGTPWEKGGWTPN